MSIVNVNKVYHVRVVIESTTKKIVRDATSMEVPAEHVLHKFIALHIDPDWPYAGSLFTQLKASVCQNCKGRVYNNPVIGNIGVIKAVAKQFGMEVKVMVCSEEACKGLFKGENLYVEDRNQMFCWA